MSRELSRCVITTSGTLRTLGNFDGLSDERRGRWYELSSRTRVVLEGDLLRLIELVFLELTELFRGGIGSYKISESVTEEDDKGGVASCQVVLGTIALLGLVGLDITMRRVSASR